MYIRLYKSLSLFHIVSEKCKKIQLTSRSVTLHHVVHHHSADRRWVSVGKTLRIETFWLRFDTDLMARYCTMHGFSRTSPVPCCTWWLGGTIWQPCGIHFCFLLLSSCVGGSGRRPRTKGRFSTRPRLIARGQSDERRQTCHRRSVPVLPVFRVRMCRSLVN